MEYEKVIKYIKENGKHYSLENLRDKWDLELENGYHIRYTTLNLVFKIHELTIMKGTRNRTFIQNEIIQFDKSLKGKENIYQVIDYWLPTEPTDKNIDNFFKYK